MGHGCGLAVPARLLMGPGLPLPSMLRAAGLLLSHVRELRSAVRDAKLFLHSSNRADAWCFCPSFLGLTVFQSLGCSHGLGARAGVRHGVLAEPDSPGGCFPLPVLLSEPRRCNGNAGQVA